MTNISNQMLLLGAISGMGLATLPGIGFATWRPAIALTVATLRAVAGSCFRRMN